MLRSDPRIHYKMYKAKRNMVYAALFSFAVLGGLGLSQHAKADTVENNNVTPTVQTVANSAQSTTGATPQSMPTQSAVSTQSPDAALHTVNSASNAQPVSAQPVVNSQDDSASHVASQTPTTTLNVQPVQPARNLAVTRQARLYVQNLAQQSTQAQATDANIQITQNTNKNLNQLSPYEGAYFDFNGSFTINSADLQPGKIIAIDHFYETSDNGPITSDNHNLVLPIKYNGQYIGTLGWTS